MESCETKFQENLNYTGIKNYYLSLNLTFHLLIKSSLQELYKLKKYKSILLVLRKNMYSYNLVYA